MRIMATDTTFFGSGMVGLPGHDFLDVIVAFEAGFVGGLGEGTGVLGVFVFVAEAAVPVFAGGVRNGELLCCRQWGEVVFPENRHCRI